jgi:hypothetical protein
MPFLTSVQGALPSATEAASPEPDVRSRCHLAERLLPAPSRHPHRARGRRGDDQDCSTSQEQRAFGELTFSPSTASPTMFCLIALHHFQFSSLSLTHSFLLLSLAFNASFSIKVFFSIHPMSWSRHSFPFPTICFRFPFAFYLITHSNQPENPQIDAELTMKMKS